MNYSWRECRRHRSQEIDNGYAKAMRLSIIITLPDDYLPLRNCSSTAVFNAYTIHSDDSEVLM